MASEERLRELEEKYEGYTVYDNQGGKIGKVDDLFVDEKDHEEYIGVKLGLLGRKSTLIPTEIVRVNEGDRTIEVSESKDHVKDAPSFDDDEDVTAEYEERVRSHFGLEPLQSGSGSSSYGATGTAGTAAGATAAGAGTSGHEEGQGSGTSGYAPGDGDHESSGSTTRDDAYAGDRASSGETYADDRETSSGTDSGYEQRSDSGVTSSGTGASEGSSGTGYYEQSGGSGSTGEQHETSNSSETMGGGSGEGSSGSQPATTRQTEETETFQEGGRTKIRRRIIREEVVDADDQGHSS